MLAFFLRDVRLGIRSGSGTLTTIVFFLSVMLIMLFSQSFQALQKSGPVAFWLAAFFASLLGLEKLFQPDKEDGSLDCMIVYSTFQRLALFVFIKCLSFWMVHVLPLVVLTPFLALFFSMDPYGILLTTMSLLVGTPAIIFVGATGAVACAALPRSAFLILTLVVPFVLPVLIFGITTSLELAFLGFPLWFPFFVLCMFTLFFAVIGPFFSGFLLDGFEDAGSDPFFFQD